MSREVNYSVPTELRACRCGGAGQKSEGGGEPHTARRSGKNSFGLCAPKREPRDACCAVRHAGFPDGATQWLPFLESRSAEDASRPSVTTADHFHSPCSTNPAQW